jgi:galactokinase
VGVENEMDKIKVPFGVAWSLAGKDEAGGVDLLVDGQLPLGAGLSSSAALQCAVAGALDELYGLGLPPVELALACQEAEHQFPGVPCGAMDQLAVMLCRERHALFIDTRDLEMKHVSLDPAATDAVFLLIETGVRHELATGAYAERRRTCEEAAAALGVASLRDVGVHDLPHALAALDDPEACRRLRHVVTENERTLEALELLERGQLRKVGPLLTASHASLRDDYEVSCAELDLTAAAAEAAGALGARMIGGGFGGSVLALADVADAERITEAVSSAYVAESLPRPKVRLVHPARGAARTF